MGGTRPARAQPTSLSQAEQALLVRAQQGDALSFESLVGRHAGPLYNLALRMLANPDDAQDAVQEAMVRAFTNLRTFAGRSAVSTWLYRITYNVCLDEIKRRSRRGVPFSALGDEGGGTAEEVLTVPEARGPEQQAMSAELQAAVQQALAQLPEPFRTVLVLYELQGLSYEEIADITGARLGTVKSRLNRARWQLKELLEPYRELFPA